MSMDLYYKKQLQNLHDAVNYGKRALDIAKSMQLYYDEARKDEAKEKSQDVFRYFDSNDAIEQGEWLQLQIKDLKNKMIEVKMENDKLLLDGGFVRCIDSEITNMFLKNTLCKMKAMDPRTMEILEETVKALEALFEEVTDIYIAECFGFK